MGEKRIVGISPWSNPDYRLIKEAGIEWLRLQFSYPFKDRINGELTERYVEQLENAIMVKKLGFKIMGITPLVGGASYDKKTGKEFVWHWNIPEWAGTVDDDGFYAAYEEACAFIASQTIGVVDMWQISNEMDIVEFRGPLTLEQAARYLLAGARGVKRGNAACKAGINPANMENGAWLFKKLYNIPDCPFDYAGIDGYFGSWIAGGPEDWIPTIEEIHKITGAPVLINEWGYSSLGGPVKPAARLETPKPGVNTVCHAKSFHYAWKEGHTPEEQAEYIKICLKIFATYPNVVGSFFYNWGDDAVCWHCGRPDCPAECGWGIVDKNGIPKVSYYAFKDTVKEFY